MRWDIRPSPHWGTLEVRFCDGASTHRELAAVAALIHCLVEHLSTRSTTARRCRCSQPWYVRENKWRAARYGLDAEIILDNAGNERPVTDDIRDLHRDARADRRRASAAPTSWRRSRRSSTTARATPASCGWPPRNDGDLTAVVKALAEELRDGSGPALAR